MRPEHSVMRAQSALARGGSGAASWGWGSPSEAAEDTFVEAGERVEFGGGEQVDHVPAHVAYVRGAALPAGQRRGVDDVQRNQAHRDGDRPHRATTRISGSLRGLLAGVAG